RACGSRFDLYGVDDGPAAEPYLDPLRRAGMAVRTYPRLPYRTFIRTLSRATVGLQPVCTDSPFSQGKSFGKVLAYLAANVPVVATDEVDHPVFFRDAENGFLVGNSVPEWVERSR